MTTERIIFDEVDTVPWTEEKAELGDCRFSTGRTPYLADLMKGMGDQPIERVVFRMPSQVGNTYSLIEAAAHEALHRAAETRTK